MTTERKRRQRIRKAERLRQAAKEEQVGRRWWWLYPIFAAEIAGLIYFSHPLWAHW